jgi:nucleoside-diphosphate-sugar epimerase
MSQGKVLVTGATGFIAKWCISTLLSSGYEVRGTVRSLGRAEEVRAAVARAGANPAGLELVEADLMIDSGWATALRGCRYVQHVASPFPLKPPRHADELIRPAKEGTLRVLRHADTAGIERVVLTSSTTAIVYPSAGPQARIYDERDWTDPSRTDLSAYIVSKTVAERAAWDFVDHLGRRRSLAVINPGLVLGPAIDRDLSSSHDILRRMGIGAFPAVPAVGYPVADVRDVAEAHLHAMTVPGAGGERFIAAEDYLTFMDMARLMQRELPHLKWRLPWFVIHDVFVRALSRVDRRLGPILPDVSVVRRTRNDKARTVLGQTFRPAEEAILSAIRSLSEIGVLR